MDEYNTGTGNTKCDGCVSFYAVLGFAHLKQCTYLYFIFAALFLLVVACIVIKFIPDSADTKPAAVKEVAEAPTEDANVKESIAKQEEAKLLSFVF